MPLILRYVEGQDRPLFVCDQCGRDIENGERAAYAWFREDEAGTIRREVLPLYFHLAVGDGRRGCMDIYEHRYQQTHPGAFISWIELRVMPIYLLANLGVEEMEQIREAYQDAALFSRL
jgi:hypothetical protein